MSMIRRSFDRRWQLRDATATAHANLDAAIGLFADRDAYGDYLRALHAFRSPLEAALQGLELHGWRPTRLAARIADDLADLNLPCPDLPPAPLPQGSGLLGTLYVLEGSVLGGQILRRRAAELDLTESFAARHLSHPMANWTGFLSLLDRATPYDAAAAADAARATFAAAHHAFTKAPA